METNVVKLMETVELAADFSTDEVDSCLLASEEILLTSA